MALVAGIDSSTQSCKVVIRDADTGELVRQGRASHPDGTEIHPDHWWAALQEAIARAGGLTDVSAISVGGQQHGMVCLNADGDVIRPALLWNDTRSAPAALELIKEAGDGDPAAGAKYWAGALRVSFHSRAGRITSPSAFRHTMPCCCPPTEMALTSVSPPARAMAS